MELYFGTGFNFWWYDEKEKLHPQTPSWHDDYQEIEVEDETYLEDMPF